MTTTVTSDSRTGPDRRRSSTCRSTRAASSIRACARRSRCRTRSRQDLEAARRAALSPGADRLFGRQQRGRRRSRRSSRRWCRRRVALQSNILGQEVGIRTNLDVLNVQQNVFSTRRDLANAYFKYLIGVLRLKAADRHADRAGPRGHQPPAEGLTPARRAAAPRWPRMRGASQAHRRSAAPRCAAWKASAAARIARARRVGEQRADVADQRVGVGDLERGARRDAPCRRFREIERVRADERRACPRRSPRSGSGRPAAAGCRRRTRRRPPRSSRPSRPSNRRARRDVGRSPALGAAPRRTGCRAGAAGRRPRRSAADGAAR